MFLVQITTAYNSRSESWNLDQLLIPHNDLLHLIISCPDTYITLQLQKSKHNWLEFVFPQYAVDMHDTFEICSTEMKRLYLS